MESKDMESNCNGFYTKHFELSFMDIHEELVAETGSCSKSILSSTSHSEARE